MTYSAEWLRLCESEEAFRTRQYEFRKHTAQMARDLEQALAGAEGNIGELLVALHSNKIPLADHLLLQQPLHLFGLALAGGVPLANVKSTPPAPSGSGASGTGTIVDTAGEPVAFATVILVDTIMGKLVAGTACDPGIPPPGVREWRSGG